MGGIMSYFWYMLGYEDNVKQDPATGLTNYEKSLIKKSWKMLSVNQKENGVEFFIQLFEVYPYTQDYFELFKGQTSEEMRVSTAMRAHATTVMYSIGGLVENLDDSACLVQLVKKIARNHFHRNVSQKSFIDLQKMFGPFLKSTFHEQATEDICKAWDKLLGVMNSLIAKTAGEVGYSK